VIAADWPQPGPGGGGDARGLPMAVVSNTLSGEPHRDFLSREGIAWATQLRRS
jgi:hypothetical protein